MGLLVLKLQEHRMQSSKPNEKLHHVTILEEAHNKTGSNHPLCVIAATPFSSRPNSTIWSSSSPVDLVIALIIYEHTIRDSSYNGILCKYTELYQEKGGIL